MILCKWCSVRNDKTKLFNSHLDWKLFQKYFYYRGKKQQRFFFDTFILRNSTSLRDSVIVPSRATLLLLPFLTLSLLAEYRWTCAAFFKLIWINAADIQFLSPTRWRFRAGLPSMEVRLRSVPVYSQFSGVAAILKSKENLVLWMSILNWVHLWPIKLYKTPTLFQMHVGLKTANLCRGNTSRREQWLHICYVKVISSGNCSAQMIEPGRK